MANRLLKLLKSPVLHLLILGTVGFFGYKVLKPSGNETIRVSSQAIDALVQQEESLSQIPVSEERKQLLIRSYIEDEILIREAYKRKLDKGDSLRIARAPRFRMPAPVLPRPAPGRPRARAGARARAT